MTGKPDRLMRLAEDLLCAKCQTRPRLANTPRCRECLRADTERELAARPRLLAGRGGGKSNHQQGAASSVVTRQTRRATRAATPPRPAPAAPAKIQPRQPPEPLTAKSWKTKISDWAKRCWGANDPDVQERVATRDIGSDLIEQTAAKIDYVYGGPHGARERRSTPRRDEVGGGADVAAAAERRRRHSQRRQRSAHALSALWREGQVALQ